MTSKDCRIYVGNLPPDVREKEIEDLFAKYGKITFIDLKNRRGPPFAFVEFDDARDADDAVRGRDGYEMDGFRLRVEFPRGVGPRGAGGRPLYGGRDDYDRGRGYGGGGGGGGRGGGGTRRSGFRVLITGLPPTGSWQDLKDHMREAGDVCFSDVFRDGSGVVEYLRADDVKYAIRKLDDTKFRSHEGETSYIRVKEDRRSRTRSRSRDRRDSRSRSPRDRRGSPGYSPAKRSRSPSASRSRSRSRS